MLNRCQMFFLVVYASVSTVPANAANLRNFRQMQAHFSDATGVPNSNYNVVRVAQSLSGSIPLSSEVAQYNGLVVRSAGALASAYCSEFIYREEKLPTESRVAHQAIDFRLVPRQITEEAIQQTFVKYSHLFWPREATEEEVASIVPTFLRLKESLRSTRDETKTLLIALCQVTAASLNSIVTK